MRFSFSHFPGDPISPGKTTLLRLCPVGTPVGKASLQASVCSYSPLKEEGQREEMTEEEERVDGDSASLVIVKKSLEVLMNWHTL